MKKIYIILSLFLFAVGYSNAQPVVWTEGFETSDSANLPSGWTSYNNSPADTLDPGWNWTVRPVGTNLPGLSTSLSVAHLGTKSVGVSWWTGQGSGIADAWLVTQRIKNVTSDAYLSFWVTGGSATYSDSVSVWISTGDSLPATFLSSSGNRDQNIFFPPGSTYGAYEEYFVDLAPYAGQNVFVGFRYNMDVALNGYYVQLDDVSYFATVGISQNGTSVPDKFSLGQNYPNPFNPVTKIKFDLAKSSNVKLTVFNSLGQVVSNLFNGYKTAGSYQADFNGADLTSGVYFYRLETDFFTETKKMQLVK